MLPNLCSLHINRCAHVGVALYANNVCAICTEPLNVGLLTERDRNPPADLSEDAAYTRALTLDPRIHDTRLDADDRRALQDSFDKPVEVLVACGHTFHTLCLQNVERYALPSIRGRCPQCRVPYDPMDAARLQPSTGNPGPSASGVRQREETTEEENPPAQAPSPDYVPRSPTSSPGYTPTSPILRRPRSPSQAEALELAQHHQDVIDAVYVSPEMSQLNQLFTDFTARITSRPMVSQLNKVLVTAYGMIYGWRENVQNHYDEWNEANFDPGTEVRTHVNELLQNVLAALRAMYDMCVNLALNSNQGVVRFEWLYHYYVRMLKVEDVIVGDWIWTTDSAASGSDLNSLRRLVHILMNVLYQSSEYLNTQSGFGLPGRLGTLTRIEADPGAGYPLEDMMLGDTYPRPESSGRLAHCLARMDEWWRANGPGPLPAELNYESEVPANEWLRNMRRLAGAMEDRRWAESVATALYIGNRFVQTAPPMNTNEVRSFRQAIQEMPSQQPGSAQQWYALLVIYDRYLRDRAPLVRGPITFAGQILRWMHLTIHGLWYQIVETRASYVPGIIESPFFFRLPAPES